MCLFFELLKNDIVQYLGVLWVLGDFPSCIITPCVYSIHVHVIIILIIRLHVHVHTVCTCTHSMYCSLILGLCVCVCRCDPLILHNGVRVPVLLHTRSCFCFTCFHKGI